MRCPAAHFVAQQSRGGGGQPGGDSWEHLGSNSNGSFCWPLMSTANLITNHKWPKRSKWPIKAGGQSSAHYAKRCLKCDMQSLKAEKRHTHSHTHCTLCTLHTQRAQRSISGKLKNPRAFAAVPINCIRQYQTGQSSPLPPCCPLKEKRKTLEFATNRSSWYTFFGV